MLFVKIIFILTLGYLTLAKAPIDYSNLPEDIMIYMDKYQPSLQSRMSGTEDVDQMKFAYVIANATRDILESAKENNNDDAFSRMLGNMSSTEIPEVTNANSDFVTKVNDNDADTSLMLQNLVNPKPSSEDESKKEYDNDAETSFMLQNLVNPKSSSEDASKKAPTSFEPGALLQGEWDWYYFAVPAHLSLYDVKRLSTIPTTLKKSCRLETSRCYTGINIHAAILVPQNFMRHDV